MLSVFAPRRQMLTDVAPADPSPGRLYFSRLNAVVGCFGFAGSEVRQG